MSDRSKRVLHCASYPGVSLRRTVEEDMDFLYRVYAATRAGEMALLADWTPAAKEAFLRSQFQAQHHHYREHYPQACFEVIVEQGRDIGRLYVARLNDEIRVMDLALLPDCRGRGIGSALMRELMTEAAALDKLVSLHVEDFNPAKRLYERLGFTVAGTRSFYQLLHWRPPGHASSPAAAECAMGAQPNTAS